MSVGPKSPQAATCGIADKRLLHNRLFNRSQKLAHQEWLSLHLVHADRIDEERRPQEQPELTRIQLRDQDASVARQNRAEVLREGIEIPQVAVRDRLAASTGFRSRRSDGSERSTPAHQQHI